MKRIHSKESIRRLLLIKVVHTLIWTVYAVIIFYLFFAAVTNTINTWVWVGVGMVMIEGVILIHYKWNCPITLMARKYSNSPKHNFDIFLPEWVARYNRMILTWLFIISMMIIFFRVV